MKKFVIRIFVLAATSLTVGVQAEIHRVFDLHRGAAVTEGDSIVIAEFAYHLDKKSDAAAEMNSANCNIVAAYLSQLTDNRHWCVPRDLNLVKWDDLNKE